MAKKDNIGLLTEIVGQLRTLNRSSVRDQLRESEALKRTEALAGATEEQTDGQGMLISNAQDFQRRFIAGQAKTFSDAKLTNKILGKQKPTTLDVQEKMAKVLGVTESRPAVGMLSHLFMIEHYLGEWDKKIRGGDFIDMERLQISVDVDQSNLSGIDVDATVPLLEMQESMKLLEHHATKEGSLYVADVNLLNYFKGRDDELDRQRNTDMRSAEERRREMIRLAGTGAGGFAGGMGDAGEDSEGGGWLSNLFSGMGGGDLAKGVGAGAGLLWWRKIAGWFGFKNDSLLTRILFRMQLWGEWLKNKFGGRAIKANPKAAKALMSGNRYVMIGAVATLVAWTFWDNILSVFNLQEKEELNAADQLDSIAASTASSTNTEINPLVNNDSGWSTADKVVTSGFALHFLSQRQLTQRIAQQMANNIHLRYATAPNGSWQQRMFKAMKSGKLGTGVKFSRVVTMGGGRAFMAAFGPWGMLAYTVWAIADWKLGQINDAENAAALWVKNDTEFKSAESLDELAASSYSADFAKPLQTGNVESDLELMKARKKRILDLMRDQSQENLQKIFSILSNGGWSQKDIVDFMKILKNEKIGDLSSLNTNLLNGIGSNGRTGTLLAGLGITDTRELGQLSTSPTMLASSDSHDFNQYNSTSIYVQGRRVESNYAMV
jgi:hypothetical protein